MQALTKAPIRHTTIVIIIIRFLMTTFQLMESPSAESYKESGGLSPLDSFCLLILVFFLGITQFFRIILLEEAVSKKQ